MPNENHAETEVVKIHPDGKRAVTTIRTNGKFYYQAIGPDGFSVGVYDLPDEATAAAQWAWDFLEESPGLRRIAMMQLIVDKLILQFPLESSDVALAPKG